MGIIRRLISCCALAACVVGASASVASAATFYVNNRNGEDSATCGVLPFAGPEGPCLTINKAVQRAEAKPAPNTIEVAEGEYVESVVLENAKDVGLTINGEEPGVIIHGKTPAVKVRLLGGVTLSNLTVTANETPLTKFAVTDNLGSLTLDNVNVEGNEAVEDGVFVAEHGIFTMNGGKVTMESGAGFGGYAIGARESTVTLNGTTILSQTLGEAGGVSVETTSLAMTNSRVAVESAIGGIAFGIAASKGGSASLHNDAVRQSAPAMGVLFEETPATVNGLQVEMLNGASNATGVDAESVTSGSWSFAHLEVGGTWLGEGLFVGGIGVEATLTDSRISQNAASVRPALKFAGGGPGRGLLVQRSVLQGAPKDAPGAFTVTGGNATTDSSEILGGKDGAYFEDSEGAGRTLTLSASTLDAGATGIAGDAPGTNGVEAVSKNGPGSVANVSIQGSIALEKQAATTAAGDAASIGCTFSAVPSQIQTAGGGTGAIACAAGSAGNSEVNPLSSLFAEPLSAYHLQPTSSAIGAVPAGALALPFGLSPSATDLVGSARTGDGVDACFTAQDTGALELPGHLVSCPGPPVAKPTIVAPKVTNVAQSHSKWREGGKAAQISRKRKTKVPVGTTFSFVLNEPATVTLSFSHSVSGRKVHRKCVAQTRKNSKRRGCKRTVTAAVFSFTGHPGTNNVSFQGRVPGATKLKPGRYTLTITARNSAGQTSAPQTLAFTIVK
jgi:hypothetical protein